MKTRIRASKKRNDRHWFEWGDMGVLAHHERGPLLVEIRGVSERARGAVIYDVEEVATAMNYPADAADLRPVKDAAERDALLAAARDRGERRGGNHQ